MAPYSQDSVSLLFGQKAPIPLNQFLEGEALADISLPTERMLLGPEELEGRLERGLIDNYTDPVLKHSVTKVLGLRGSSALLWAREILSVCESDKWFVLRAEVGEVAHDPGCPASQPALSKSSCRPEWECGIIRRAAPGPRRATIHSTVRCQGLLLQIGYHRRAT